MMMTEDVILSDLSACLPATSLCPQWSNGKWMLVDYETESGIAGRDHLRGLRPVREEILEMGGRVIVTGTVERRAR